MGKMQIFRPGQPINFRGREPVRHHEADRRQCPPWLMAKYKKFRPSYSYGNGFQPVELEKVRHWPDTREWVGVYYANLHYSHDINDRSREKYVWAWRGGRMVEIKQFGTNNVWRASRPDWNG